MQLWSAALNGRTSRKDRICRYRCRMFPCAIHTTYCHSQSIACWRFLGRQGRLHLPNSSFQRLRNRSCIEDLVYDLENRARQSGLKITRRIVLGNMQVFFQEKWTLGHSDAVFPLFFANSLALLAFLCTSASVKIASAAMVHSPIETVMGFINSGDRQGS